MAFLTHWDAAVRIGAFVSCTIFLNFPLSPSHSALLIGWESFLIYWILCILSTDIHKDEFVFGKQFQVWNTSKKFNRDQQRNCIISTQYYQVFYFSINIPEDNNSRQMQWAWDDMLRESSLKIHLRDTLRASHILHIFAYCFPHIAARVRTNW